VSLGQGDGRTGKTLPLQRAHVVAIHVLVQGKNLVVLDFDHERVAVVVFLSVLHFAQPLRLNRCERPLQNQSLNHYLWILGLE